MSSNATFWDCAKGLLIVHNSKQQSSFRTVSACQKICVTVCHQGVWKSHIRCWAYFHIVMHVFMPINSVKTTFPLSSFQVTWQIQWSTPNYLQGSLCSIFPHLPLHSINGRLALKSTQSHSFHSTLLVDCADYGPNWPNSVLIKCYQETFIGKIYFLDE